jgi:hypothetical protein
MGQSNIYNPDTCYKTLNEDKQIKTQKTKRIATRVPLNKTGMNPGARQG